MQTLRSVVAFQSNFDLFKVVSFQIVFLVLQCVILRFNVGFHDINQGINQTQELWPKRKKKKRAFQSFNLDLRIIFCVL